jgi:hypothetical protein
MIAEQRQVGETALNHTSSRSHQIIRLVCMLFTWSYPKKKHGVESIDLLWCTSVSRHSRAGSGKCQDVLNLLLPTW